MRGSFEGVDVLGPAFFEEAFEVEEVDEGVGYCRAVAAWSEFAGEGVEG